MNKIRIGVLGYANIAKRSLIPAIEALNSQFTLVGIGTRDPEAAAKAYPDAATKFCTYDELLSDSTLDAVYNPLPTGLHFEWTKKASSIKAFMSYAKKSLAMDLNEGGRAPVPSTQEWTDAAGKFPVSISLSIQHTEESDSVGQDR